MIDYSCFCFMFFLFNVLPFLNFDWLTDWLERERNINQLPPAHTPTGTEPEIWVCALTWTRTCHLLVGCSNQLSHTARDPFLLFKCFVKAQGLGRTALIQSLHTALQLGEILVEPQPRYAKLIMELLITKCLKGYLKETNIEGKKSIIFLP